MVGLLILPSGQYQDFVSSFPTMRECEAKLFEARKKIPARPGVYFTLVCAPVKPTDGVDI